MILYNSILVISACSNKNLDAFGNLHLISCMRYLGIQLDKKLNWKEHIVTKRKHIDVITKKIRVVIRKEITSKPGK
jgi:hypothetical protein